jgi:hypothetical protein
MLLILKFEDVDLSCELLSEVATPYKRTSHISASWQDCWSSRTLVKYMNPFLYSTSLAQRE